MPEQTDQSASALAGQWSRIAGAAEVAARTYRVGPYADDVAQTTALRVMEYAAANGGMPNAATIGQIAKRAANALARTMAREPVGIGTDITDQQRSADDGTRARAAVAGRRARIGVRQRHDVFAVAESSRVAMRPADDVSAITYRAAALAAALDAEWSPERPAERAAWDAMRASAADAEPVATGPLTADAEPADTDNASRGAVVALARGPLTWQSAERPAPASRAERRAARSAARVARSDAEYAASRGAGALVIAERMAADAADARRAATDGLHRVRPVISAERSAEPAAIGHAERPADILLSAYRPETLTTRKSPDGSGPVVVVRGVAVPCGPVVNYGEPVKVKSPATGRMVTGAPREVAPAGVIADAGRGARKVRLSEVLPTESAGRAAQAALGRAVRGWAGQVSASVRAAEVNQAAAIRTGAAERFAAESAARIGPRTYWWVRRAPRRVWSGPVAGCSRVASAEAAADMRAADAADAERDADRYAAWWSPVREPAQWPAGIASAPVAGYAERRAAVVARWHATRATRADAARIRQHADRSPNARLALAAEDGPAAYFAAWRRERAAAHAVAAALCAPALAAALAAE